jgi:hypothetical protein
VKRIRRIGAWALLVLISAFVATSVIACSADQIEQGARDVQFVAGGTRPSTQPSNRPGLDAARNVVRGASLIYPPIGELVSIVGGIAGVVAGIAGHRSGKRSRKQAHSVVAEVVADVATFKQPTEPWTQTTAKLLTDLGYHEAARAVPTLDEKEFLKA